MKETICEHFDKSSFTEGKKKRRRRRRYKRRREISLMKNIKELI